VNLKSAHTAPMWKHVMKNAVIHEIFVYCPGLAALNALSPLKVKIVWYHLSNVRENRL
jgi:hypothetical protein